MKPDMDDIALQFIGELINEREAKKDGYSMPARWLCLRDDLKEKYLAEARKWVQDWWADEQAAKISRDEHIPYSVASGRPPRAVK